MKRAAIQAYVNSEEWEELTPEEKEAYIQAVLDTELFDKWEAEDKEFKLEPDIDTYAIDKLSFGTKYLNVKANLIGGGVSGLSSYMAKVDGTAYADGTVGNAFKQGSWGTKDSGTALVGELGREILVRGGRFYTIGDEGAEFINYKRGDIIFNHKQADELFKHGKVTSGGGRGKALAGGTAFVEGNAFDGGTNGKAPSIDWSSSYSSSSKKSSSSDSADEFKETIDWIEIAIDRIERAISRLDLKASSVYKTWSSRNKNLEKEISKVGEEISLQESAYERYIKEADSVGLSASWAKKVRDGKVDIETIKDEKLADKISQYSDWYGKALDCKDAIDELKESESELYKTAFDSVVTQYEGILSVVEHERSMLEEYISQAEESGYLVSVKYYEALMNTERSNIKKLEEEKAALLESLREAVASGAIEKGSEAW